MSDVTRLRGATCSALSRFNLDVLRSAVSIRPIVHGAGRPAVAESAGMTCETWARLLQMSKGAVYSGYIDLRIQFIVH